MVKAIGYLKFAVISGLVKSDGGAAVCKTAAINTFRLARTVGRSKNTPAINDNEQDGVIGAFTEDCRATWRQNNVYLALG